MTFPVHSISSNRRTAILKVAICCTTRRRRELLVKVLNSIAQLSIPPEVEPVFVVVENDTSAVSKDLVDGFIERVGGNRVIYQLEPEIGIPYVRNRAIELSIAAKADIALFVDDDETVAADWLEKLIEKYRTTDLMLIGGPVRSKFDTAAKSGWEKVMEKGITARYQRIARKANENLQSGREGKITIVTNNWLADLRLFTVHNLKFDTNLRFTGGSDSAFYRAVRRLDLPTGWAPDAIVYETVTKKRSSLSYQFKRGMEQSKTSLHAKFANNSTIKVYLVAPLIIITRLVLLLLGLLLLPFSFGAGIVRLARSAGWITGRIFGLFGSRSKLYQSHI